MSVPFQSFIPHFQALARVGFYKLVPPSESAFKNRLHQLYRIVMGTLIVFYNLQRVVFLFVVWGDTAKMISVLFLLITTINCVLKYFTINFKREKMQILVDTINGPYFQPTTPYHDQVLASNAKTMSNLLRVFIACVLVCCSLDASLNFIDILFGQTVEILSWFPFQIPGSPKYEVIILYLFLVLTIIAYGHTTMDCFIVAFYAQASTQIKILRYNLENMIHDAEIVNKDCTDIANHQHEIKFKGENNISQSNGTFGPRVPQGSVLYPRSYLVNMKHFNNDLIVMIEDKDLQKELHKRFVFCVEHYKTILWFIEEIQSTFKVSVSFQCTAASWIICMTVYHITEMEEYLTLELVYVLSYLMIMLSELFMFCYYGTKLTHESEQLIDSIYCSQWLRTTPRFRKMLLIQMSRFSRPIEPKVAFIVPLSLATYTSVVKFSYTLFTFLRQE